MYIERMTTKQMEAISSEVITLKAQIRALNRVRPSTGNAPAPHMYWSAEQKSIVRDAIAARIVELQKRLA